MKKIEFTKADRNDIDVAELVLMKFLICSDIP